MDTLKESVYKVDFLTGAWDLGSFLENSRETLGVWGNSFVMLIGLVALVYAVWQIVTGLMSQGKKQTNWFISILLLIVGGVLSASTGFEFVKTIAGGGRKTIEDLGGGTILFLDYWKYYFFK
ncbi:hypothetical protein [Paenibacillus glucanolyticus]|uniref:hypothetical protein n=1 Tax=Paenibacillus glucanolyticus TaxID=59843 RepID=UPI00096D2A18|nr:hypothetical protein [Paenibacillus glucanolyticus]OMF76772.1 hypothetical protein BK142_14735 [Paenibacillus glucanolyticus]